MNESEKTNTRFSGSSKSKKEDSKKFSKRMNYILVILNLVNNLWRFEWAKNVQLVDMGPRDGSPGL